MNHDAVRAPQGAAGWTPADDSEVQGGARVTIAESKTDQTGEGRHGRRADGPDAVAWLRRWLAASGIDRGPIFRMVADLSHGRRGRVRAVGGAGAAGRRVRRTVRQVAEVSTAIRSAYWDSSGVEIATCSSAAAAAFSRGR